MSNLPLPDDLIPQDRKRDRVAFWVATVTLVLVVGSAVIVLIGAPA